MCITRIVFLSQIHPLSWENAIVEPNLVSKGSGQVLIGCVNFISESDRPSFFLKEYVQQCEIKNLGESF